MKNLFMIKRAYTQAFAVFVSILASYYYTIEESYWVVISTFLVMQTTIGVALRQSVQRYIALVLSVSIGTVILLWMKEVFIVGMIAAIGFSVSCYLSEKSSPRDGIVTIPLCVGISFFIVMLSPIIPHSDIVHMRLYNVTLGAGIGIIINLVVFPIHVDKEFRNNLIPIFHSYENYLSEIINLLFREEHAKFENAKKYSMKKLLRTQAKFFPDWVYEFGLSIRFQPGHRHFLIMVERVGQILFSMHHIATHSFDSELLQIFKEPIVNYTENAKNIIHAIVSVLYLKNPVEQLSDLSDEVDALEKTFQQVIPVSLELLDMSKDYILLASLITDMKDFRITLIKLAQSLRSSS